MTRSFLLANLLRIADFFVGADRIRPFFGDLPVFLANSTFSRSRNPPLAGTMFIISRNYQLNINCVVGCGCQSFLIIDEWVGFVKRGILIFENLSEKNFNTPNP
ncbi:MAG: hypothetical protein FWG65_12055 [Turicibacter sp.]|nr:hypothetical protein [Turicibacter sp.]